MEGHAAQTGGIYEMLSRRVDQMELNVDRLGRQLQDILDKFKEAEKQKMRRQAALNQLIRAIAEVGYTSQNTHERRQYFLCRGQSGEKAEGLGAKKNRYC